MSDSLKPKPQIQPIDPISGLRHDFRRNGNDAEARDAMIVSQIGWENNQAVTYDSHRKRVAKYSPDGTVTFEDEVVTHLDTRGYEPKAPVIVRKNPKTVIINSNVQPNQRQREWQREQERLRQPDQKKDQTPLIFGAVIAAVILLIALMFASSQQVVLQPQPQATTR